jgi:hypothetical protein
MKRHWVYWRSAVHGDDRIWGTLLDADGCGYTLRYLYPPSDDLHHAFPPTRWGYDWRVSRAEADRIVAAMQKRNSADPVKADAVSAR